MYNYIMTRCPHGWPVESKEADGWIQDYAVGACPNCKGAAIGAKRKVDWVAPRNRLDICLGKRGLNIKDGESTVDAAIRHLIHFTSEKKPLERVGLLNYNGIGGVLWNLKQHLLMGYCRFN